MSGAESLLVVVVLVGVVAGLVRPRPARFGAPRAVAVVFAAVTMHAISVVTSGTLHAVLLASSILVGLLWVALQHRHLASVLLAVGVGLNAAVIAANGGMPVDSRALDAAGRGDVDVTRGYFDKHVPLTDDTRFSWLADLIPVPLQGNVISVGDALMGVAIALWVADAVGSWSNERRSAGTVHGQHRRGPRRQVVRDSE